MFNIIDLSQLPSSRSFTCFFVWEPITLEQQGLRKLQHGLEMLSKSLSCFDFKGLLFKGYRKEAIFHELHVASTLHLASISRVQHRYNTITFIQANIMIMICIYYEE